MTIDPRFHNPARIFGQLIADELENIKDLWAYDGPDWRNYQGPLLTLGNLGNLGIEYLRWIVDEIKKQHDELGLPEDDRYRFGQVAEEIIKNLPPHTEDQEINLLSLDDDLLLANQFKVTVIVPALFPTILVKPPTRLRLADGPKNDGGSGPKKRNRGAHLTLVRDAGKLPKPS